jgi:hypothetical protein
MQPQGAAMNVPVSSVLPPPLVPTSSPMTTLKPQPTGRNWASASRYPSLNDEICI